MKDRYFAPLPPEGGFKKNFKTSKTFERFFRNQIPCQRQASSLRFGLPAFGGNDKFAFSNPVATGTDKMKMKDRRVRVIRFPLRGNLRGLLKPRRALKEL